MSFSEERKRRVWRVWFRMSKRRGGSGVVIKSSYLLNDRDCFENIQTKYLEHGHDPEKLISSFEGVARGL